MRDYELLLLIRPTLDENAARETGEQVANLVQNHQGTITKTSVWGRRKLAYPIDDQLEATYILHKFRGDPASLREIEFELKLDEAVLRYLITKDMNPAVSELTMTEEETSTPPPPPTTTEASAVEESEPVQAEDAAAEEPQVAEATTEATEATEESDGDASTAEADDAADDETDEREETS